MMKSFAILMIALLLLFGCSSPPPAQNITNSTSLHVVKTPSFTITSPQEGDVIAGTNGMDVPLVLSTQNLALKAPGGAAKKGEGHFRVTVDSGDAIIVTSKTYTIQALSLGAHTVKVQLYNNDRTPYSPQLVRTVHFTINSLVPLAYVPLNYFVNITDLSYQPVTITVNVGDTITFTNVGSRPASATAFASGKQVFNTQVIGPGATAVVTLNQAGQFGYYSLTNPLVRGTVVVQPDPTQ